MSESLPKTLVPESCLTLRALPVVGCLTDAASSKDELILIHRTSRLSVDHLKKFLLSTVWAYLRLAINDGGTMVAVGLIVLNQFLMRENPRSEVSIGQAIDKQIPSHLLIGGIAFHKVVHSVR